MNKQELIKSLNDLGVKKSKIETDLGMPKNSLSGMLSGSKEISVKWFDALVNYVSDSGIVVTVSQELSDALDTIMPPNEVKNIFDSSNNFEILSPKSKKEQITKDYIHPFDVLLRKFNKLIDNAPSVNSVKKELNEISELAKQNHILNFWQKDAILKRCDNYINGSYCSTSKLNQI